MITRILYDEEATAYDAVMTHPIQTWAWGDFLKTQGHIVYRLGVFDESKLVSGYSINFHLIPHTKYTIGVLQRGPAIDADMLANIKNIGQKENAIFIKIEPDLIAKHVDPEGRTTDINPLPEFNDLVISPKVAFFPHSYIIDLTKSQDQLLADMHSKTRYNIRVANRHNVEVVEDNTDAGFKKYLDLLWQTTRRQGFYLHSKAYHQKLWQTMKKTGLIHILLTTYQGKLLTAMMFFAIKDRFFYPYGASSDKHRNVMASTLTMWQATLLGKKLACTTFDMWGCLGPNAKASENGFGFHKFKQGFGGQLVQFVGTYDYVLNPNFYKIYNLVDKFRWKILRAKALFSKASVY